MSTTRPWHDMIVAPRTVQASARTPGMTLGRTPMSANLGLTPAEINQAQLNRAQALIPDNWAALTHEQLADRRARIMGVAAPKPKRDRSVKTTRKSHAELVEHWFNKARDAECPGKFIMVTVPEKFRNEVVALAAAA